MPIYLRPPAHRHGGPDGRGWNRLSLNAHMGLDTGQCALRPRSWSTLVESRRDTRLAEWGPYGHCARRGACDTCPLFSAASRRLDHPDDTVAVYVITRPDSYGIDPDQPYVVTDDPTPGSVQPWTWEQLARLEGWRVGRRLQHGHAAGFWLHRDQPSISTT